MGTPVGLTHDSYNGNTRSCSNWLSLQNWVQFIFVAVRESSQDINNLWHLFKFVFSRNLSLEFSQIDLFSSIVCFY
jgi:hypothetical protein